MDQNNAGSATSIDLAALEQLARAADDEAVARGEWFNLYQLADGVTLDASAELMAAADPATILELIALARATVASPEDTNPQHIPRNCTTHRTAWRDAITECINAETTKGNHDQAGYWQHELAAYDRAFARLLDNPEPVQDAATPQHSVTEQALWMPVMAPCEGGVILADSCGDCRREGAECALASTAATCGNSHQSPFEAAHQPVLGMGAAIATAATQPEQASERELLASTIQRASVLTTVGMEFGAALCRLDTVTIKRVEYLPRDSVMGEVAAWRAAFDAAPKVDSAAVRAALAIPAAIPASLDPRLIADLARSREKYPSTTRMFDGLMGEVDELRRAYGGDGDCTAEAFDVAVVAYRIATEGDEGGNVSLAPTAASEQQVSVSEAAITAAMSEGNKHGVNSIVAAHIVAAYTLALSGRATIPSAADEQASIPNWKARRNADRELLRRAGENDRRLPVSGYMLAEIADLRAALTHRATTAYTYEQAQRHAAEAVTADRKRRATTAPAGYKLVPVEPTPEMIAANGHCDVPEGDAFLADDARETWTRMIAAAPGTATTAADQQGNTASASEPQAAIVGAPLDSYAPKDQAFFKFWYSHMKDEVMQPPLSETWHSTARYIWDAAIAQQGAAQDQVAPCKYDAFPTGASPRTCARCGKGPCQRAAMAAPATSTTVWVRKLQFQQGDTHTTKRSTAMEWKRLGHVVTPDPDGAPATSKPLSALVAGDSLQGGPATSGGSNG